MLELLELIFGVVGVIVDLFAFFGAMGTLSTLFSRSRLRHFDTTDVRSLSPWPAERVGLATLAARLGVVAASAVDDKLVGQAACGTRVALELRGRTLAIAVPLGREDGRFGFQRTVDPARLPAAERRLAARFGVRELALEGGDVVALVGEDAWPDAAGGRLVPVLLETAAELGCGRVVAAGERVRCALCHDGIVTGEVAVVSCERCATPLHDECWRELGRCPVLGCDGRPGEGERVPGRA